MLRRVPIEAVKCNTIGREKEVGRLPFRYIESVVSPDGCVLGSNREMRDAFRTHFCDRFTCHSNLPLKQIGLKKSPRLDGLSYQVYLRLLHMFVPILMDVFNHWFAQGAIHGSVTKGVIALLKKDSRHVWEDNYWPITVLSRVMGL